MGDIFSDRIADVPKSFIREILKVTTDPSVISFAGGLPNRNLFPVEELKAASNRVFEESAGDALQYGLTEGFGPLREWISARYKSRLNIDVPVERILITTGSQQGLDLIGKTFLNEGDHVAIEEPGYLGAIQAFSLYRATFHPLPLTPDGINPKALADCLDRYPVKLFYGVPNFQNPSGTTYSEGMRKSIAYVIQGRKVFIIEDDPYGELRFEGEKKSSFYSFIPENTILLGSFSKTVVPSFRIGWVVAPKDIIDKLVVAKQASDLHTNNFGQRVIHRYLMDNDINKHIAIIREAYGRQRNAMTAALSRHFKGKAEWTLPEGGMFLWMTLPKGVSALALFDKAIKKKVAFVPGDPFYVDKKGVNALRLNFSCVDEPTIDKGVALLAEAFDELH